MDEEYHRLKFLNMKRCSEFSGHERAEGKLPSLPTKKEMNDDLAEMITAKALIRKKKKDIRKRREEVEQGPPKAATI